MSAVIQPTGARQGKCLSRGRGLAVGAFAILMLGCSGRALPEAEARAPAGAAAVSPSVILARGQVPITMYMTHWCPVCVQAHRWLKDGKYTFVALDVERNALARAQHASLNPAGTVPTFVVGQTVVVGFSPERMEALVTREAAKRAD